MTKRRIFAIVATILFLTLSAGLLFHTHSTPSESAGCFWCAVVERTFFIAVAVSALCPLIDAYGLFELTVVFRPLARAPTSAPMLGWYCLCSTGY